MTFETALEQDADAVCALYTEAVAALQAAGLDQWDDQYPDRAILTEDIGKRDMLLLRRDGRLEAAAVVSREQDELYADGNWSDGDFAVLHRLCVKPSLQNRGVGRRVVQEIERMLAQRGVDYLRLDAFEQNPAALGLYERLGYKRVGSMDARKGRFGLYEKRIK